MTEWEETRRDEAGRDGMGPGERVGKTNGVKAKTNMSDVSIEGGPTWLHSNPGLFYLHLYMH